MLLRRLAPALALLCGCGGTPAPPPPAPIPEASIAVAAPPAPEPEAAPPPEPPDPWKVGALFGLSGPGAEFGHDGKAGVDLAVLEVNGEGGVRGRPIDVVYEDDGGDARNTPEATLRLIERHHVIAVIGELSSSAARAGGIVANEKRVPFLSPGATLPDVTEVGPFMFRACFIDTAQAHAAAELVAASKGPANKPQVGILWDADDPYSAVMAREFRARATALGARVVVDAGFPRGTSDFSAPLREIAKKKPHRVFVPVYVSTMIAIAQQARAVGVRGEVFVGGDGWGADELLLAAGPELEGAHMLGHFAPDDPAPLARAFVSAYTKRYRREPSASAALSYDAAKMLAGALARAAEGTPEALRDALAATQGFEGVTGRITLDEARNPRKPVIVLRIHDGRFVYHATTSVAPAP